MSEQKIEEFWRDATADDVARVMKGERVEARFRDHEKTSWFLRKLIGFNSSGFFCNHMECWKQCQVYDPPAIRQVEYQADYALVAGFTYPLPNGSTIRVTEKGFEVG
jgi:hypothetical protein